MGDAASSGEKYINSTDFPCRNVKKKSMYRPLSMMSRTQTLDLPHTVGASSSVSADFTQSLQINRPG